MVIRECPGARAQGSTPTPASQAETSLKFNVNSTVKRFATFEAKPHWRTGALAVGSPGYWGTTISFASIRHADSGLWTRLTPAHGVWSGAEARAPVDLSLTNGARQVLRLVDRGTTTQTFWSFQMRRRSKPETKSLGRYRQVRDLAPEVEDFKPRYPSRNEQDRGLQRT